MIKLTGNFVVAESMCHINRPRKMHNSVEDFGKLFTNERRMKNKNWLQVCPHVLTGCTKWYGYYLLVTVKGLITSTLTWMVKRTPLSRPILKQSK